MHSRSGLYDDCQWQRGLKLWFLYGGLSLVVGAMDWVGWLALPRGIFERLAATIHRPASFMRQDISSPLTWINQRNNPLHRIADLESRLAAAAVDQARLHELELKIEQLESMVQTQPSGKRADRIVELISLQEGQLWIAAGEKDQIKPDQLLLDSNGVFIGKVSSIGRYTSRILLPGESDFKVAVQTTSGTAKGVIERIGSNVVLTSVLQTESLQVGDILVTSAANDSVLPRIVVAQVTSLTGSASDPTKGAEIILLANRKGWAALW